MIGDWLFLKDLELPRFECEALRGFQCVLFAAQALVVAFVTGEVERYFLLFVAHVHDRDNGLA